MNETRFNRSSWIVLGVSVVLLAIIGVLNVYRYGLPTDGWVYEDGLGFQANILGLPSEIQPGDQPIALDGVPFDTTHEIHLDNWFAGGSVQYTVQRAEQPLTFSVPIANWTLRALWSGTRGLLNNYLIGLFFFVIGLFVFLRKPGNSAAQVLFFLGIVRLSMALIFIVPVSLADLLDPFALNAVALLGYYIWGLLLFPTLLLLSLVFPKPKWPFRSHPLLTVLTIYMIEPVLIVIVGGPQAKLGPTVGFGLVAIYGVLTLIAVVHSFLTTKGDIVARAQIRWVGFGVALVAGYQFLSNLIGFLVTTPGSPWWMNIIDTFVYLSLPVTIGFAILRFRLFDIDVIIRKTIQYTLLTGLLALVYFGSVILLQNLTESLFGKQSPFVIVFSTLAIAALFNPLRIRLQDFIDRRFYRSKYDSEKALAQFATTARDEVDIEKLSAALLDMMEETMQPVKVSLLLRGSKKHEDLL